MLLNPQYKTSQNNLLNLTSQFHLLYFDGSERDPGAVAPLQKISISDLLMRLKIRKGNIK